MLFFKAVNFQTCFFSLPFVFYVCNYYKMNNTGRGMYRTLISHGFHYPVRHHN